MGGVGVVGGGSGMYGCLWVLGGWWVGGVVVVDSGERGTILSNMPTLRGSADIYIYIYICFFSFTKISIGFHLVSSHRLDWPFACRVGNA